MATDRKPYFEPLDPQVAALIERLNLKEAKAPWPFGPPVKVSRGR